jgi:hypothetical protein
MRISGIRSSISSGGVMFDSLRVEEGRSGTAGEGTDRDGGIGGCSAWRLGLLGAVGAAESL